MSQRYESLIRDRRNFPNVKQSHSDTDLPAFKTISMSQLVESALEAPGDKPSWRPKRDELHLWLFNIARPPLSNEELIDVLSADEVLRAKRFHFADHRSQFIAAHGLMRLILSVCGSGLAKSLAFSVGENDKPSLVATEQTQPLSFNLSHSGCWGLLAIAATGDIGVDIEEIRSLDGMETLAADTFTPSEVAELAKLPVTRRLDGFFACWTRKEALIKADGRGLEISLDSFEVSADPDAPAALLRADGAAKAIGKFGIWDLPIIQGYRAAVAAPLALYDFKYYCII
tara:strand:- start:250 stop:1107 length:858 start_codon:yes stop_codon:yes gene_type:complete